MPRQRKDSGTARITPSARYCLDELVDILATTKPVLNVDDWELVGALIYAARRSPLEAVRANVGTYRDLELLEIAAAEAVCGFLQAHAG